jgi:hypothetical protein
MTVLVSLMSLMFLSPTMPTKNDITATNVKPPKSRVRNFMSKFPSDDVIRSLASRVMHGYYAVKKALFFIFDRFCPEALRA